MACGAAASPMQSVTRPGKFLRKAGQHRASAMGFATESGPGKFDGARTPHVRWGQMLGHSERQPDSQSGGVSFSVCEEVCASCAGTLT